MSRFARRIYYLSAFLVFAIVGPLLVAWTAGYRWSTIRSGFIRTGSLSISSEPRATVHLNGIERGTTPFRVTHLPPGTYVIELTKTGLSSWRQEIAITQNNALTIGPVMLYPPEFSLADLGLSSGPVLASPEATAAFQITTADQQYMAKQIWPTNAPLDVSLPWVPTTVTRSRNGQTTIWQNAAQAVVTFKNQPADPWHIDVVQQPVFDPASESIFYGLQAGHIVRYDSLTREHNQLALGTSFTPINDTLWLTQQTADTTTFMRQPSFGQHLPNALVTLPGQWLLVNGPPGTLLIHNMVTRELATITQSFGTEQFITTSIGFADQWWWNSFSHPPLWMDGSDLMTLSEKKEALLLDRLSETPAIVAWVVPGHILLVKNGQRLFINSASARQGRSTLVEKVFDQPTDLIGLDVTDHAAMIVTKNNPQQISQVRW